MPVKRRTPYRPIHLVSLLLCLILLSGCMQLLPATLPTAAAPLGSLEQIEQADATSQNVMAEELAPQFTATVTPLPQPTSTPSANCEVTTQSPAYGETIPPASSFYLLLTVKNISQKTWSSKEVDLRYVSGTPMQQKNLYDLPSNVKPGDSVDLVIPLTSPSLPGNYAISWALMRGSAICVFNFTISVK